MMATEAEQPEQIKTPLFITEEAQVKVSSWTSVIFPRPIPMT